MQIKDVMTQSAETVDSDALVIDAATKMKELNVGSLPVCDNGKLQGLITDRDIIVRLLAEGRDPLCTRIGEIMTAGATYCFDDQTLDEAASLMEAQQIRRLPILNRHKELVGMLSLGDIAVRADTIDQDLANEALKKISEPSEL